MTDSITSLIGSITSNHTVTANLFFKVLETVISIAKYLNIIYFKKLFRSIKILKSRSSFRSIHLLVASFLKKRRICEKIGIQTLAKQI
ncbi:unnamed protein product [Schistosoma mattheei]|uniref:Uncharacterized protein n=1 Tax=Schistosoma mattheei TaxID=31246 RepID=A0AA85BRU8_9TREM|nr:unnamed protein product [Schistosoma mattheei]